MGCKNYKVYEPQDSEVVVLKESWLRLSNNEGEFR